MEAYELGIKAAGIRGLVPLLPLLGAGLGAAGGAGLGAATDFGGGRGAVLGGLAGGLGGLGAFSHYARKQPAPVKRQPEVMNWQPDADDALYHNRPFTPKQIAEHRQMPLDKQVKEVIVEQLGVKPQQVKPHTHICNDLGADSLDQVELAMALEEQFGRSFPDEDLERLQTPNDYVKYLKTHGFKARASKRGRR